MRIVGVFVLVALLASTVSGQSIIEYGKLAGATTGAAPAAKSIGASVNKVFEKTAGTLSKTSATPSAQAPASASPSGAVNYKGASLAAVYSLSQSGAAQMPPKPSKSDFAAVELGMTRDELIDKVGKPSFSTTASGPDGTVEVLEYDTREGTTVKVRVAGGRVFSIDMPSAEIAEASASAVIHLAGKK